LLNIQLISYDTVFVFIINVTHIVDNIFGSDVKEPLYISNSA